MEFDVNITGLEEITEALHAKLEAVLPAAAVGVGKVAKSIEKAARKLAPVDTGELQRSIRASEPEIKDDGVEARVAATAKHSVYVEYGTGIRGAETQLPDGMPPATYRPDWPGQEAQPFMYPAKKMLEGKAQGMIADEIKKEIST